MAAPAAYRFVHRLRVRWAECDLQGIVFFGRYYEYFDVGMTEYLRALGFVYPQFFLERGGDLFICHSHCDYHGSARFDEDVDVHTRVARLGRSSIGFDFQLRREEELLTSGEIIYVFADPEARRSRALPQVFRAAVRAYEPVDPQA